MISVKNLQALVAVVEEKSFTRAAEKLYQTQPGLSMQVRNLENYIGARLVDRKDSGIGLTDAGELFYPEALKILAILASAKEAVNELKGLKRGRLSVGASTLPGEYIIPGLIAEFRAQHPGINVSLLVGDTKDMAAALKSGTIMIAFLGADLHDDELEIAEFRSDELVLIGPPDWPEEYDWSTFPVQKLILREKGSGTRLAVENHLAANAVKLPPDNGIAQIGSTQAIIRLVAAGAGISYVSRWAGEEPLKTGQIKILNSPYGSIRRKLYAAVLKDSCLCYAARAFWDFALSSRDNVI